MIIRYLLWLPGNVLLVGTAAGRSVCREEDLYLNRLAIRAKKKASIRLSALEKSAAELKLKEDIEKGSLCCRKRGDGDQASSWLPHPY